MRPSGLREAPEKEATSDWLSGWPRRVSKVQTETKAKVDEVLAANGRPVTVLRFTGDISSSSRDTVLGTYEGVVKSRPVLIDFSKVEYINSSGIDVFHFGEIDQYRAALDHTLVSAKHSVPRTAGDIAGEAKNSDRPSI